MVTSRHYSMEFLGWSMIVGMLSAVPLTLVTLPALLFLVQKKRLPKIGNDPESRSEQSGPGAESDGYSSGAGVVADQVLEDFMGRVKTVSEKKILIFQSHQRSVPGVGTGRFIVDNDRTEKLSCRSFCRFFQTIRMGP